jgi:hypothetical protein
MTIRAMLISSVVALSAAGQPASSKEIEGEAAKAIVMSGEVLGMTLFDDFFKRIFQERDVGFIYSVKYDDDLYYCYNFKRSQWFCESF